VIALNDSAMMSALVGKGLVVAAKRLSEQDIRDLARDHGLATTLPSNALVLEHPPARFPSFAHEWCPGMLRDAGRATITIAETLLEDGWGLKDASPHNVLFEGPRPVLVDVLSIERRDPEDSIWLPYAQFQRGFALPLLAARLQGVDLAKIFLSRRDGLEPEAVYSSLGTLARLRPGILSLVSIPTWLGRRHPRHEVVYEVRRGHDANQAAFVLRRVFRHLRRQLEFASRRSDSRSHWLEYADVNSYSTQSAAAKREFVARAIDLIRPSRVLDVGCNTGAFSTAAARAGAFVVAIDNDVAVVEELYAAAVQSGLDILPLVVDLARPSPPLGWRNAEQPSFLSRAHKAFDLVLLLAVLHHLLVTDGIPLDEVLSLVAELTQDAVVVEFVAPEDLMFRRLSRGRDHLHSALTREAFEVACSRHFRIISALGPLDQTRWMYLLRKGNA
jgi:2-polyprenyl-3-methyl-5-hydroxy-6-metoxy-1,4-benzoquinol methylase